MSAKNPGESLGGTTDEQRTGTPDRFDVAIDDLRPDPVNPRKISDTELESLTHSLKEFGLLQPVLARHEDHVVIGGHQWLVAPDA